MLGRRIGGRWLDSPRNDQVRERRYRVFSVPTYAFAFNTRVTMVVAGAYFTTGRRQRANPSPRGDDLIFFFRRGSGSRRRQTIFQSAFVQSRSISSIIIMSTLVRRGCIIIIILVDTSILHLTNCIWTFYKHHDKCENLVRFNGHNYYN